MVLMKTANIPQMYFIYSYVFLYSTSSKNILLNVTPFSVVYLSSRVPGFPFSSSPLDLFILSDQRENLSYNWFLILPWYNNVFCYLKIQNILKLKVFFCFGLVFVVVFWGTRPELIIKIQALMHATKYSTTEYNLSHKACFLQLKSIH